MPVSRRGTLSDADEKEGNPYVEFNCPHFSMKAMGRPSNAIPEPGKSLKDLHPELVKEWDYERNEHPPDYYKQYSNKKAHWICSKDSSHRWFSVINNRARLGVGCPRCSGRGKSNDERVAELIVVHGNRYDYSEYVYNGGHGKSTVICSNHGAFQVSTSNHRHGKGCPACARKTVSDEDRISEFREVHGDRYDYSKYTHKKNDGKSIIICPMHGEFGMPSWVHRRGSGCQKCAGKGLTHEDWLERFREIHGDYYDYSRFKYSQSRRKSVFICPQHGEFRITPNKHLMGRGCPGCTTRGFNPALTGYYYVHEILDVSGTVLYYKAGISNDVEKRTRQLEKALPEGLRLNHVTTMRFENGQDARDLETRMLGIDGIRYPKQDFDGGHELFIKHPFDLS